MARGLPGVWSFLLGGFVVAVGWYLRQFVVEMSVLEFGLFVLLGLGIAFFGLYIHFVAAPDAPAMIEDESVIDTRTPAPYSAAVMALVGLVVLGVAIYLFYFTQYRLHASVGLIGLYLLARGLYTYWTNTLTVYYVTSKRVIKEYRFISLVRSEIKYDDIEGVQEHQPFLGQSFGIGTIRVRSGARALEITIEDIYDTSEFADMIRDRL